jgi:hypothetical protein
MKQNLAKLLNTEPKRCWVGESNKVIYETKEEAEGAARLTEVERNLKPYSLGVHKCDFAPHYHLTRAK